MAIESATVCGVPVYVDTRPNTINTHMSALVGYGSLHEPRDSPGLAHALEHCIHLGTTEFPTSAELEDFIQQSGGFSNAWTGPSATDIYARGPQVDSAVRYIAQVLFHASFPPDAVQREMSVIQREAKTYTDDDSAMHYQAANFAIFGEPYRRSVIGYANRLGFSVEQLTAAYHGAYGIGNVASIAVGAATIDDIETAVRAHFGERRAPRTGGIELKPILTQDHISGLVRPHAESVQLLRTKVLPADSSVARAMSIDCMPYQIAIEVINRAIGEALRGQSGLSYDAAFAMSYEGNHGDISVSTFATLDGNNLSRARKVIADVLSQDAATFPDSAILSARGHVWGEMAVAMDSPGHRLEIYTDDATSGRPIRDLDKMIRQLSGITTDQIREAIGSLLGAMSNLPTFEHRTGSRENIGKVDAIITQDQFA